MSHGRKKPDPREGITVDCCSKVAPWKARSRKGSRTGDMEQCPSQALSLE